MHMIDESRGEKGTRSPIEAYWFATWVLSTPYLVGVYLTAATADSPTRDFFFNLHDTIGMLLLVCKAVAVCHVFIVVVWQAWASRLSRSKRLTTGLCSASVVVALLLDSLFL